MLEGEGLSVPPNGVGFVMPCHVCPRHAEGQLTERRVVTKVDAHS